MQFNRSLFHHVPFNPAQSRIYYGWFLIPLGAIGILMSVPGQTVGISTFTDSLIASLGISRNSLSLAYMFGTIGSSLMLTWAGKKYDQYGVRITGIVASVLLGLVLFYLSNIEFVVNTLGAGSTVTFGSLLIGFLFLRLFGQGVITLVSRNMTMKWFESFRGTAAGITNIFVTVGFSMAPVVFEWLIVAHTWQGAWLRIAMVMVFIFPVVIFMFFRDNPEKYGLKKDGGLVSRMSSKKGLFKIYREFTLPEARSTRGFWIFGLFLAFQGLYITGFTFNVTSIFEEVNLSREEAIGIFFPSAVIAAVVTLIFSVLSDYIRLKILLLVMGAGAFCSTLGIVFLGESTFFYYQLIVGNAFMMGLFGVISSTVWPKFYGSKNLGAISGSAMTLVVFASALGPIIFSSSYTFLGSYQAAGWFCFGAYVLLTLAALKADNPQEKLKNAD